MAQTLCGVAQARAAGESTYATNATESCEPSWKKLFTATFRQQVGQGGELALRRLLQAVSLPGAVFKSFFLNFLLIFSLSTSSAQQVGLRWQPFCIWECCVEYMWANGVALFANYVTLVNSNKSWGKCALPLLPTHKSQANQLRPFAALATLANLLSAASGQPLCTRVLGSSSSQVYGQNLPLMSKCGKSLN